MCFTSPLTPHKDDNFELTLSNVGLENPIVTQLPASYKVISLPTLHPSFSLSLIFSLSTI